MKTNSVSNKATEINNSEKTTHEPFINRITKIKNASTEDVVAIGGLIQEEIRRTINPTKTPLVTTSGNWKSTVMHRLGLLMSGTPSSMPLIGSNNIHQEETTSVIPQASTMPSSASFYHGYQEVSSTAPITPDNHIKKIRKKRSLENSNGGESVNKEKIENKYDLTKDNIEDKIFKGATKKKEIHHKLLDSLKNSIDEYKSLKDKNSREGIEKLKQQANILAKIYNDFDAKDGKENYLSEKNNIIELISEIQTEYKSHRVEIEKNIHVIWIAGAPPESITKYAKAYKAAYPDFVFNLWVDPNAMSAYAFNKQLREAAFENAKNEVIYSLSEKEIDELMTKENLTEELNKKLTTLFEAHLFKSVLQVQDAVMNYAYVKGLLTFDDENRIDFLKEILHYDDEKIEKFKEILRENIKKTDRLEKDLIEIFGRDKITVNDVTSLSDMKKVHRKQHYQQELILRGNYAAATDQLRMYILKEQGGIYTDYDVTPGYTQEVYKIIQENSKDFDFLEKEDHRRALNDEILSFVSGEESTGLKNKLNPEDRTRLDNIINEIKKIDKNKIFSPIETKVIRDSMVMSKRYQWWGKKAGWNIRGNNNFLATHKGSKVTDFVTSGQDNAYREIFNIREQLRTEGISEHHYYHNPNNNEQSDPLRGREKVEAKLFASDLESNDKKARKKEVLKDLDKDLKEYGQFLTSEEKGVKRKDIRASDEFLKGYSDGNAVSSVSGFRDEMNIKEIVDLMKKNKGKLTDQQVGALSYEVESRALSVTFQPKVEEYHKLFDKVASSGEFDKSAKEKLMPQLFLLNLVGDGYGGRCDPLSILMVTEKYLESKSQQGQPGKLIENLYSAAAVLNAPSHYTDTEVTKAKQLLNALVRLHAKNPMHSTKEQVWKEKKEKQPINDVVTLLKSKGEKNEPVLLKLEAPGHAMAAWAVGEGTNRVYGFYDANGGTVEFSDINKLSQYINELFGKEGLDKANKYHLKKNGEAFILDRVVVLDGEALSNYKTGLNEKSLQDILKVNVFDPVVKRKTIKIKEKKIKFDPKKYKEGTLFSKYRMDGTIPRMYSTLYITGPDAIMKSMKTYYNSLGELGQCRLDQSDNRFKGLAKDSFVGNLEKIVEAEGEHYDWVNQNSAGINDVTPDDASTWIGKKSDAKEIFSNLLFTKQTGGLFGITPTKLDIKRLMIGWPSDVKDKLKKEWSTLEEDYNKIVDEEHIDLDKLSDIDKKIHRYLLSSDNNLVKWVGISLADQLTVKLNKVTVPIENKVHYLLTDINRSPDRNKKSIYSLLSSDKDTKIVIWKDDDYNKALVLKELSILEERQKQIRDLITTTDGHEVRTKLETYYSLKNKDQLGTITHDEHDTLSVILSDLSQDEMLRQKLVDIENKAHSAPAKKNIKVNGKEVDIFKIKDANELKKSSYYGDIVTLWNKYITNENKKIDELLKEVKKNNIEDRIEIKNISYELKDNHLIKAMIQDGYGFEDLDKIVKYGILSQESGVMIQDAAMAAPSTELVKTVLNYTGGNDADAKVILKRLYHHFFGEGNPHFGPSSYEQALKVTFYSVLESLDKNNLGKYFLSVMNQDVSALGVRFSSTDGILTSEVMISGMKDGLSKSNVVLDGMKKFFTALYEVNSEIKKGKSISIELIKSKFNNNALGFMLQDDMQIDKFLETIKDVKDISLTEISRGLTGKNSFVDCATHITAGKFPSITNNILKEIKSKSPSVFSMPESTFVEQGTLKGLGHAGSDSYITNPVSSPKLHDISIQAKYRALKWGDFYGRNAKLWQDTVTKFGGSNTKYHPQMLLTPEEGRCMGLAELYLLANSEEHYKTLQENLDLASALYQESQIDQSQLSEGDKHLLDSTLNQVEHAQQHGNNKLLYSQDIEKIRLSDFETKSVADYLIDNKVKSLLITTDFHSMVVSAFDGKYRVTDPNFGYADFTSLEQALNFIEHSIQISPEVRELYTGTSTGDAVDISFVKDKSWKDIVSSDALDLTTHHHQSTLEKIKQASITIDIKGKKFDLLDLYKYGVFFDGARIDDRVSKTRFDDTDVDKLKVDVEILKKYVDEHYLSAKEHEKIKVLAETLTSTDEQKKISIDDIFSQDAKEKHLARRLQAQSERVGQLISGIYQKIQDAIKLNNVNDFKVRNIVFEDNSDLIKLKVEDLDARKSVNIDIDISDFKMTLREGLDALTEGVDRMNLDGIMSILGIIQYARLTQSGDHISAVDHANLGSDVKTVTEKVVGSTLMLMGKKNFGSSISDITFETMAAQKVSQLATKIGGPTGKVLSRLANVIRFPLLDTALNLWSLGESVQNYLNAGDGSAEKVLAEVDVAFASTFTALTLGSFAFPPLGIAAFPLMFLQQEVRNFQLHLHQENARRAAWVNVEKYLNQAEHSIVKIDKDNGVIDLSPCQIVGDLKLDLSAKPPKITGEPSYNLGKDIGNNPRLSDEEVRKISRYAIACVDRDEINVPNLFGSSGGIHCRDLSSESNLVRGFGNRNWPSKMPSVPEGDYSTVILGYTSQIRANTEVIYMTWNGYQEVARQGFPVVEHLDKHTEIITGDKPVRIVLPKLESKMFTSENRHDLRALTHYWFTVRGGDKGVTVYPNGVGNFNIKGKKGAKNILSFSELPYHLNVHVDLNKTERQTVVTCDWSGYPKKKENMMDLVQENINTLVGSNQGNNIFIGNNNGNHFITGHAFNKIHLGKGSNVITVPDVNGSFFDTILYLEDSKNIQYLQLGCSIDNIHKVRSFDNNTYIYFSEHINDFKNVIKIHFPKNKGFDNSNIVILTEDGLELGVDKSGNLFAIKIDMVKFAEYHKDVGLLDPEDLLSNKKLHILGKEVNEFDYGSYNVFLENECLTYKIKKTNKKIYMNTKYSSTLYGSKGSTYWVWGIEQPKHHVVLHNDNESPENIDISSFTSINNKVEVTAYCQNDKCVLKVYYDKKTFELTIKPNSIEHGHLKDSKAKIILDKDKIMTLEEIFILSAGVENEVLIHKNNKWSENE
ncbi:TcdA/TcdB catalytic glycosyltransferase domain-containing protein [Grimontia hollisae]|uniref:TcdA/TcdB catalytic glycosyltransferase domain-containing protein n=1 Tax=Grimontia hollisae TaxID=673 RepID=UPI0012AC923D|nr:TcdA/TcdB catalytic glycosyltransferase domain-containing protein [Grimontia hollisae]